jgi:hypothetical protein
MEKLQAFLSYLALDTEMEFDLAEMFDHSNFVDNLAFENSLVLVYTPEADCL